MERGANTWYPLILLMDPPILIVLYQLVQSLEFGKRLNMSIALAHTLTMELLMCPFYRYVMVQPVNKISFNLVIRWLQLVIPYMAVLQW